MSLHRIAVVIVNYNSEKDLQVCAGQIVRQEGIQLSIILVDNASRLESLHAIKDWLIDWRPDAVSGTASKVHDWVEQHPERAIESHLVYFIESHENRGYSAGNNIGIRLAASLSTDAVLIANPDMRIENRYYLKDLADHLFADPQNYIAASSILGLDGEGQNPLREASFGEELFWPYGLLRKKLLKESYVVQYSGQAAGEVKKVSGCCFLARMSFFRNNGLLDENVFLYCEEPILAANIKKLKGKTIYIPTLVATHAHVKEEKSDGTGRMLNFIKSRKYYLKTYSGYKGWQLLLLDTSYAGLAAYSIAKGRARRMVSFFLKKPSTATGK